MKENKETTVVFSSSRKAMAFLAWLSDQGIRFRIDRGFSWEVTFIHHGITILESRVLDKYWQVCIDRLKGLKATSVTYDEWHVLPETDRVNILSSERRKIKEEMRRNNELAALEDRVKGLEIQVKSHNERLELRAEWDDTHNEQIAKLNHRMDGITTLLKGRASRSTVEAMDKNLKRVNAYARDEIKDIEDRLRKLEDLERTRIIEEGGWDD
jgi:hypothetical protein